MARTAQVEKDAAQAHANLVALRVDLEATRQRLDNALRANADSSGDFIASKQRLNELAGRVDEVNHGIDELRRDVGASRTELYARLDELKRVQPPPAAPPAPIAVPADKDAHYKQLEAAFAQEGLGDGARARARVRQSLPERRQGRRGALLPRQRRPPGRPAELARSVSSTGC